MTTITITRSCSDYIDLVTLGGLRASAIVPLTEGEAYKQADKAEIYGHVEPVDRDTAIVYRAKDWQQSEAKRIKAKARSEQAAQAAVNLDKQAAALRKSIAMRDELAKEIQRQKGKTFPKEIVAEVIDSALRGELPKLTAKDWWIAIVKKYAE